MKIGEKVYCVDCDDIIGVSAGGLTFDQDGHDRKKRIDQRAADHELLTGHYTVVTDSEL